VARERVRLGDLVLARVVQLPGVDRQPDVEVGGLPLAVGVQRRAEVLNELLFDLPEQLPEPLRRTGIRLETVDVRVGGGDGGGGRRA
jgi:hypothetical protein